MKPLKTTKGASDKKEALKAFFSSRQEYDLDEREPIERVADEVESLAKALLSMGESQITSLAPILKAILQIVEKPEKETAVNVSVSDTRPLTWHLRVDARDESGRIEEMTLTADKEKMT